MVAGMEARCTCNSFLAKSSCSLHPCPFCKEKDSRIRELEDAVRWAHEVMNERDYIYVDGVPVMLKDELLRKAGMQDK